MSDKFLAQEYKLSRNPFPPAASGIDIVKNLWIPERWEEKIKKYYELLQQGKGAKAFPIVGEYGSGKTVLLKGYLKNLFEDRRIKTIYFENPGVKFYDLANTLMRSLGRYEFSKALWEICKEYLEESKSTLFPETFKNMLFHLVTQKKRQDKAKELLLVIKNDLHITNDEEVAYRLGLMIVETASKPYFSYRDFVAGPKGSLVPENEESKFFKAIIKAIIKVYNVEGIAFLIDEFEEIALSKRMTRKQSYEYLATLRSLMEVSEQENLWIIVAMTPDAADTTKNMNVALWQRFVHQTEKTELKLEPLTIEESKKLIRWWLSRVRKKTPKENSVFPFSEDIEKVLERPEIRLPRALIKIGFFAISRAVEGEVQSPIPNDFVKKIIEELYPSNIGKEHRNARE